MKNHPQHIGNFFFFHREHLNVLMEVRNYLSYMWAEYISIYCHYLEGNGTILVDNLQNEQRDAGPI